MEGTDGWFYIRDVFLICLETETFYWAAIESRTFYFLSQHLYLVLITLVQLFFGQEASLLYKRIQPLSLFVLQGPVPLQTNEETQAFARTTTVKNSRTALLLQNGRRKIERFACNPHSIISYVSLSALVSFSPTMLLLVNDCWLRTPTQKLLCDVNCK